MSHPGQRKTPSDDGHTPQPTGPGCWRCGTPGARGSTTLAAHLGGGTRIAICAAGEGCRDGRIFHGPSGPLPHFPDKDCPACPTRRGRPRRNDGPAAGHSARRRS